jgi:hypothetical protein
MRVFLVERLMNYRQLQREGASEGDLQEHDALTSFLFCAQFRPDDRPGLAEVRSHCYLFTRPDASDAQYLKDFYDAHPGERPPRDILRNFLTMKRRKARRRKRRLIFEEAARKARELRAAKRFVVVAYM